MKKLLEKLPFYNQAVLPYHWVQGIIATTKYHHPAKNLKVIGVTGTNGKTTTCFMIWNMLNHAGLRTGLMTTVAYGVDKLKPELNHMTTVDAFTLNQRIQSIADQGAEYLVLEVTSHALAEFRTTGIPFELAVFTNLTHDHLDYHKTFSEYIRCKKMFFDNLDVEATAIINTDDKNGQVMVQNTKAKVVTYSCRSMADHTCRVMEQSFEGMLLKIDGKEAWTGLIGQHNAYNLLALYSTAVELGADPEEVLVAMSTLRPAPGRLENMKGPKDISVIIDYAHTPDALENVLKTLREIAPDRELICLFGCGGDRDKTKRPEMGLIAQKMADRIIVTSDNSRTEKTSDIMADIKTGMDISGRAKSLFIEDREEAIRTAIMLATPGATVLLAGKGHETYQIIGTEKRHFDEKEIVEEIFKTI